METLQNIIIASGYLGIFVTIFAESGFLLGIFLPGDSLLFTLGLFASKGSFSILILWILSVSAAILGDSFGYFSGRKFGPAIFSKENSLFFRKSYLDKTQAFYDKYGKKTIILARFVPIVRTLAPIFAGVANMNYRTFVSYNIIGGILWPSIMLFSGFFLGNIFPGIKNYLSEVILIIIFLSFLPVIFELVKTYKSRRIKS
ncbi:MAG: VTT domain-containing protein [Candidatus Paceibacterota bacterium]